MPSFGDKNVDDRCQEESEIDCYWDEDAIQEQLIGEKIRIEQTKHVEIFQNVFSCASMSDKTILDYPVHKTGFIHNYECMQLVLPRLCTKLIAGQKQFPIKGQNLKKSQVVEECLWSLQSHKWLSDSYCWSSHTLQRHPLITTALNLSLTFAATNSLFIYIYLWAVLIVG